jgi:hypothetical protein
MDKPNFASYNLKGLLALHNEVAKELRETYGQACPDRKAFKDKPKGIASCEAIWATVSGCRGEPQGCSRDAAAVGQDDSSATEQGETGQAAPGDTVENTMNEETVDTEAVADAPKKRTRKAKEPTEKRAKAAKAPKAEKRAKAPKAEGAAARGRRARFEDGQRIYPLVEGNPKREGSGQHALWQMYKGNPTLGKFVERVEASGKTRKDAIIRVSLDVDRALVEVR